MIALSCSRQWFVVRHGADVSGEASAEQLVLDFERGSGRGRGGGSGGSGSGGERKDGISAGSGSGGAMAGGTVRNNVWKYRPMPPLVGKYNRVVED